MIVPLVRGAREVDQRARRGDARRQADPAGRPEERRRRRSRARCHLPDGHAGLRAAAAEAARRHREGAGRGHGARQGACATSTTPSTSRPRSSASTRAVGSKDEIEALARSAVSQFESYVKLNKKISPEVLGTIGQIEDYSKLADTIASHLAIKIADKQEMLEITTVSEPAGARLHADGERDLRPAGREEDPLARQAPDGEDPARVLPE